MKTLEVRRHSLRTPPEEHLSKEGLELAEDVGRSSGGFAAALSSPLPRARETAEAMGVVPTRVEELWSSLGEADDLPWPATFLMCREALARGGGAARLSGRLVASALRLVQEVPEDTSALIITHGGLPELLAAALFPAEDARAWGGALRCMEGIRITFEGGLPVQIGVLRLDPGRTRL
ncbi:MAG: histidine phosphatase family protein [Euryarchaeota archaeon]|nr:histidine phosphatase family protein [Euryarchaeota archaeon]MDE1836813.1 histidine phosphatase family protein [Euryarchaeota archaeon]MDE1881129.1 histidine phosphatase family protein [Euryarchaeota archaeon]MDE2044797.1 histidine phosphatase family protein [Thermoplasmata archaeon]